jgi:hypothetical protein
MKAWIATCLLIGLTPTPIWSQTQEGSKTQTEKEAAETDAYWDEYGERREKWVMQLAFDPTIYFFDPDSSNVPLDTRNAVDAQFWHGRSGIDWAFAIERGCPGSDELAWRACPKSAPLIRVARGKLASENSKAVNGLRPKTEEEMRAALQLWMRWEEADLSTCKGALDHLAKLNRFEGDKVWSDREERDILNKPEKRSTEDIMVHADADHVVVRAKSYDFNETHIWTDNGGSGTHGAWARDMMAIAKPCLKPTTATPPWKKREEPD